jgi:broad specificity phosphatase PhoE
MAIETGQFIREYLKDKDVDEIIIESSPFIRTMTTAAYIAKEIGIE